MPGHCEIAWIEKETVIQGLEGLLHTAMKRLMKPMESKRPVPNPGLEMCNLGRTNSSSVMMWIIIIHSP